MNLVPQTRKFCKNSDCFCWNILFNLLWKYFRKKVIVYSIILQLQGFVVTYALHCWCEDCLINMSKMQCSFIWMPWQATFLLLYIKIIFFGVSRSPNFVTNCFQIEFISLSRFLNASFSNISHANPKLSHVRRMQK